MSTGEIAARLVAMISLCLVGTYAIAIGGK